MSADIRALALLLLKCSQLDLYNVIDVHV